jgi:hypothetical protein
VIIAGFGDCRDQAIFHRRRGCDAQRLTIQAAIAEELAAPWNRDDAFFPLSDRTVSLTLIFWM